MHIAVIGGGSWGCALAQTLAAKDYKVSILVRREEQCQEINSLRTNSRYLPGISLHSFIQATTSAAQALSSAQLILLAVPCQSLRESLKELHQHISPQGPVICVSKGLEVAGQCRMSEIVIQELPQHKAPYAILSGPSFAEDVVKAKPTAVVLGCADAKAGEGLRELLSSPQLRVYSTTDVTGVELGGALKNIMAIAAGISDGLELGHSARAALITRGITEISRLGTAMGANPATFMGLSGMGDLVLTCTGDLSRNRQVGLKIGQGQSLSTIIQDMHQVAEGVKTTEAALAMAHKHSIEVPIITMVKDILDGNVAPHDAVITLMSRNLKEE